MVNLLLDLHWMVLFWAVHDQYHSIYYFDTPVCSTDTLLLFRMCELAYASLVLLMYEVFITGTTLDCGLSKVIRQI